MPATMTMRSWKHVCLPTEHGVWGLLAGSVLVGLPLAGDLAGLGLLVAALAAIVVRQGGAAWRHGARRQAGIAIAVAVLVGMAGVAITWQSARSEAWLGWAAAMAGVGTFQVAWSWWRPGRPWLMSACGGAVFALLAGAVAAAGGAPSGRVVIAVAVLTAHFAAMIPLVRAQTRREPSWSELAIDLHLGFLITALAVWAIGLVPWGIPLLLALGLARAMVIVDKRTPMSAAAAARIGAHEMLWLGVVAAGLVLALRHGA